MEWESRRAISSLSVVRGYGMRGKEAKVQNLSIPKKF